MLPRLMLAAALLLSFHLAGSAEDSGPRPFLGVQIDDKLKEGDVPTGGIPVSGVVENSSAALMGVVASDLLLSVNGQALNALPDLQRALAGAKVGDTVVLELKRGEQKQTVKGELKPRPVPQSPATKLKELDEKLKKIEEKAKEPNLVRTLDELVMTLKKIETDLPKAAEAFKKQYPNGEFSLTLNLTITSDKTAKDAIDLGKATQELKSNDKPTGVKDGTVKPVSAGGPAAAGGKDAPKPAP